MLLATATLQLKIITPGHLMATENSPIQLFKSYLFRWGRSSDSMFAKEILSRLGRTTRALEEVTSAVSSAAIL